MNTSDRPRFEFLDGLRGLAALYVVMHHAYVEVAWTSPGLSSSITRFTNIFDHGTLAVGVFIVLSGFVLMEPVLASEDCSLAGGLWGYFKRRARRILPPYYAAMAICLLLIATVPILGQKMGTRWDAALPGLTFGAIGSHLLLVHNFCGEWIWQIDNPMWSVATEWQVYFVFALILLPIWKRLGIFAAGCVAMAIGMIAEFLMPPDSEACFHFIGLFAFGMAAAQFAANPKNRNWNAIANVSCLGLLALIIFVPAFTRQPQLVMDLFVGVSTAVMLCACAVIRSQGGTNVIMRLLESRPARKLGEFSYSLYLMHFPIIALGNLVLREYTSVSAPIRLVLLMTVVVPLSLIGCWGFYLICEQPFTTRSRRRPSCDAEGGFVSQRQVPAFS